MNAAFPFATQFGRRAAEFFRNGGTPQQQAQQPSPPRERRNPPASKRAIRQLPTIIVAPEDLVDPNNRECCICLEENHLNAQVLRLPCAHIFHSQCILDWLKKSNTCPVCRLELVTDDEEYEVLRKEKMQQFLPRYAKYELQRMTIRQLRQLGNELDINLVGCMEKQDVIDVLLKSGKIQVISAPRPVEYPLSLLRAMKISELKQCMANAGVFFDPILIVEKEDMVQLFLASGRLVVVSEEEEEATVVQETIVVETTRVATTSPGQSGTRVTRSARSASTPVVTTVLEDSSDDDDSNSRDSKPLPQSNPLMEEIVFEEANAPDSHNGTTTYMSSDDNSSVIMEEEDHDEDDNVDKANQVREETDGTEMDMNEPTMDSLVEENSEMQQDTDNVETAYPRLVGRHASTGSEDIPLVDDYASTATASEDSRFVERSIADLQALAREMRVDITDCIERSEITARLVSATGRTDLALEPNDFCTWSVSELRALARAVNVDLSCCSDRLTMIAKLIEVANERPRLADYLSALMPLAHLTVPQLRAVGREWQVNLSDCIEKEEMIHRLVIAGGPTSSSSQHD